MKIILLKIIVFSFLFIGSLYAQAPAIIWEKTIGGQDSEYGRSVQETFDNGFILTGWSRSFLGHCYVKLIKTDSNGDTSWTRTFGSGNEMAYEVCQSSDSGYVIVTTKGIGVVTKTILLIKTDSTGNEEWTKVFGGDYNDTGFSVKQTLDSGYIIAGSKSMPGHTDIWLIKTDSNGDTSWTRTYGGNGSDHGLSVQQTSDSGYVITGYTDSFGSGGIDVYLIETDSNGDTSWTKTFGGSDNEFGNSVQETHDGGYIITGYTYSYGSGTSGEPDLWLIKTDSNGDTSWTKTFGDNLHERGECVRETHDNGFIITGYAGSSGNWDGWLIKTNSNGDSLWTKTIGNAIYSVQQISDSGYIATGHSGTDFLLCRLAPDVQSSIENFNLQSVKTFNLHQNYPNPFNPSTKIKYELPKSEIVKIEVFNLLGQKIETVLNKQMPAGSHEVEFTGKDLPSGVYLYRIKAGNFREVRKMILLK